MRMLRDFRCRSCDETFERYIDNNIEQVTCECGGLADRIIGMPRVSLDGTDPSFPGAYDKWARTREDNARIKAKKSYAE
jgi:hypothetical protein